MNPSKEKQPEAKETSYSSTLRCTQLYMCLATSIGIQFIHFTDMYNIFVYSGFPQNEQYQMPCTHVSR